MNTRQTARAWRGMLSAAAGIALWIAAAPASGQCPFGSIQARVQPNISTPWTVSLNLQQGQTFRVGGFYNGTGLLDTTGNVRLELYGPGGTLTLPANGSTQTAAAAGTYTLRAYCVSLNDYAYVYVTGVGSTNARRFHRGMGVAWGGGQATVANKMAWDRANLDQVAKAGATATHVSFDWTSSVQPTSTSAIDWSYMDHMVMESQLRGLEMFAFTGQVPDWAKQYPQLPPHRTPPAEAYQTQFASFHTQLAQRYCGRVKFYEFWNEQNGCGWYGDNCSNTSDAQIQEYTKWLQRWYTAMKAGCSDTVLAIGGLACAWGGTLASPRTDCGTYVSKIYQFGGGNSFDAVAMHPYGWAADAVPPNDAQLQVALTPDASGQNRVLNTAAIAAVSQVLAASGHSARKLWLDEWGYSTNNDALQAQLVDAAFVELSKPKYSNVFEARYLTLTEPPTFRLATPTVTPSPFAVGFALRPAWSTFRTWALGTNTARVPLVNPGFEFQGTPPNPPYSSLWYWGLNGAWAFHKDFVRTGNEVLGRKFGYYSAGTTETVNQILSVTYLPGRTYRLAASVQGGGDNTGTVPLELGYQKTDGNYQVLKRVSFNVGAQWSDVSLTHVTGSASAEVGRPIWVRFASGGLTDIWFDDLLLTLTPP